MEVDQKINQNTQKRYNPFCDHDMIEFMAMISFGMRNVNTLRVLRLINRKTYRHCESRRKMYYFNHWTLVHYLKAPTHIETRRFLMDTILNLLLGELEIVPNIGDVVRMVEDPRFNRINSRELMSWPICLDELIPDCTPGGNYTKYVVSDSRHAAAIISITKWITNVLHFDVSGRLYGIAPTSDLLEDFVDEFYDLLVATEIPDPEPDYYKLYHNYDISMSASYDQDTNITLLINKIKYIYIFISDLSDTV
jgi:hypothetical protein